MSRRIATKEEMPLKEKLNNKTFQVIHEGQNSLAAVEREIQRRLELIKDSVVEGKNGKKVIATDDAFSAFIGEPKNTVRFKTQHNGRYEEQFLDGNIGFVGFARGYKGRKEFRLEEAAAFLETKLRKKEELVDVHAIAKGIKLSHTWIKRFFNKEGEKDDAGKTINMELDGKIYSIILRKSKRPFMAGKKPLYMVREEYELFKKWIEINYKLKRTWDPNEKKPEIPEGWYSTIQTAKKLGLRESQSVRLRLKSGKLKGKEFHGINIISAEEINRFIRLREMLKPPEGCIKISVMLERTGLSESQYSKSSEKIGEGKQKFIIKNRKGETEEFTVYNDIDGHRWIKKEDAESIEKMMDSKKTLIRKEKTAEILGIDFITLEQNIDPVKRIVKYNLSNGKSVEIPYIVDKNISLFDEKEVKKARKLEKYLKENMRLIPDIAKALGLSRGFTKHWIEDLNHVFEFDLNGKKYKIEMKRGKFGALFLYKNEFFLVIKWRKMTSQQTHCKLNSRKICRNHIRQAILYSLYDEKKSEIILHYDNISKIAIPVEQTNGELYIKKEYAGIIDFFFDINGIYLHTRERAVRGLIKDKKQKNDIKTIKLMLLREALKKEKNREFRTTVERLMDDPIMEELMEREMDNSDLYLCTQINLNGLFAGRRGVDKKIIPLGDESRGLYVLAPDYGIVVPVTGNNGNRMIEYRDAELIKLYLGLFHPVNGESFANAVGYLRKVHKLEELNPRIRAGLWIVRQFAMDNFDLINMDDGKGKYLFDRLEEPHIRAVWAGRFENFSRYFIHLYPVKPRGISGRPNEIEIKHTSLWENAMLYLGINKGDLAGTYS